MTSAGAAAKARTALMGGERADDLVSRAAALALWAGVVVAAASQASLLRAGCGLSAVLATWRGVASTRGRWPTVWLVALAAVWVPVTVLTAGPTAVWLPAVAAAGWLAGAAWTGNGTLAMRRRCWLRAVAVGSVWAGAAMWTAAADPTAAWFGPVVSHGSRGSRLVALTFDDGPNDSATLAVADLLASRGARGSFFVVGAAAAARPDLVRALVARGEVVGDHSFRHGTNDWLDPAYPEAERGQRAILRVTGRCPALFRPPHGHHSPFTARAVASHGMRTVTWDVSGHDWNTSDAALVAARVLHGVRGGSIVLLHDGSDGDPTTDRTVVVRALPLILDGLANRGLRPVGLDELLGTPAWTRVCSEAIA